MNYRILQGDARDRLRDLPDGSVRTCVTSPPYWGLRDYGVPGQLGLEATPDEFVVNLVAVFREVRRVLADDGTLWMNLGDSYLAQQGLGFNGNKRLDLANRSIKVKRPIGVKPKDLVGIPWMVAFALRADGWYLRSDIIWSKPNPMPESIKDRPTKAHEYIFLLSKQSRYYYDADAITEVGVWPAGTHAGFTAENTARARAMGREPTGNQRPGVGIVYSGTRNKRSVWHVATQPYPEAHFATYPEKLIEPCILAGSQPGDTVLDPFNGSGTTGVVAIRHQRSYIGVELNPEYIALAERRIGAVAPLFTEAVS
jgi:DNA modification methylase